MPSGIIPQWFPECWTSDTELSFYWWDERTLNRWILFSKCSLASLIPLGEKGKGETQSVDLRIYHKVEKELELEM